MWRSLKQARLAFVLLIYFLFVVAFSIMTTTFALYTMHRFDYDALHNGYLFLLIGTIAAVVQGTMIGKLAKRFGEMPLVIVGALMFTVSLAIVPFVGPQAGGLVALLAICGTLAVGNSLATPALTSLSSKSVSQSELGSVLGVTQSAASLARVVGPLLSAFLIYSATGPKHISDASARLALFARDAVKAKIDYKSDMDAVKDRTVRLRQERLEREAVIRMPAPKKLRARRIAVAK